MSHIDVLGKPEEKTKKKNETRKKGEKKENMHFSISLVISNRSEPGTTHT